MREAGAGGNNFSLAHMRRERVDNLEKQVKENTLKLSKRSTPSAYGSDESMVSDEVSDDSTSKIQSAKAIAQEYKKKAMDGTEGTDFSTDDITYD